MTIPANLPAPALDSGIPIGAYVEFQLYSSKNLAGGWTVFGASPSNSIPFTCSSYSPTTLSSWESGPAFVYGNGWPANTPFPDSGVYTIQLTTVEGTASNNTISRTTSQLESVTYQTINARIGITNGAAQSVTALTVNDGDACMAYNRISGSLTVYWAGYHREGAANWRVRVTRTG